MSPQLSPKDPNWHDRVTAIFDEAAFLQLVGIELLELEPGFVTTSLMIRDELCQHAGLVHAGVQATIADHSAGGAAATLIAPESNVLTVEFKINLLRPAKGDVMVCRSKVIKPGRQLTFCQSDVFVRTKDDEIQTASATVTIASIEPRSER